MGGLPQTEYLSNGGGSSLSKLLISCAAALIVHNKKPVARMVAIVKHLLLRDGNMELMDRETFSAGLSCIIGNNGLHARDGGRLAQAEAGTVGSTTNISGFGRANSCRSDE